MAFLIDTVFDSGLSVLDTNGTQIDITTSEISSWAALAAATAGNDTVNTGAPENATSGRKVIVPAITAGSVTATVTATHWCLSNGTDTVYAAGPLTGGGQAVTSGNTFTLDAIEINLLDASAV